MANLLSFLGSPRFHAISLIFASAAAIESMVAIWAATSRRFWFWRALAVWSAVMALAPICAYEPALTFAISSPLIALLIILQKRYETARTSESAVLSESGGGQIRFTMRDLFLFLAIVGLSLAGILHLVRRIHHPTVPNYALNVSALTFVTLAATNFAVAKRRLPSFLLLMLVIAVVALAIPLFGSVPETYDIVGLLDVGFHPSHLVVSARNLALTYSELAILLIVALKLAQVASFGPPTARARLAHRALSVGCTLLALPLAILYWQLLWLSPLPPQFSTGPNQYYRLLEIARRMESETAKDVRAALIAEVAQLAESSNYVPFDPDPNPSRVNLDAYTEGNSYPFRNLGHAIENDAAAAWSSGEQAAAVDLRLTNIRLGLMLQRGGERATYLVGRAVEGGALERFIRIRRDLTPDQTKKAIAAFQRALDEREPPEDVLRRDWAIGERAYGWGWRLDNVLEGLNLGAYDDQVFKFVASERVELLRLLQTDLAIRLYRHGHGRLPQSLADLVPNYLPAVPLDIDSGKPLVYRPAADDFLLYGVGHDGVDNGGNVTNSRTYYFGIDKGDHRHFGVGYDFDLDTLTRP